MMEMIKHNYSSYDDSKKEYFEENANILFNLKINVYWIGYVVKSTPLFLRR